MLRWLLPLALFLTAHPIYALEVKELKINYRNFHPSGRLLELPGLQVKEGLNLGLNLDLIGPFYWNSTIRSLTDGGGYKFLSYNFFLGVRVFSNFYVEYEHRSGHAFDRSDSVFSNGRFPVEDSLGFQWYLIRSDANSPALF
jgi:hypothetical protein